MNNNKHIHDEDYEFSIKLIVPLLSILVCTICLCATTWAWYTASVSTGVNSIVAGANINETISIKDGNQILPNDGVYFLENSTGTDLSYEITFNVGDATYGYFAEITIEDAPQSTSFMDLFINRIYADENDIEASGSTLTNGNYYYYVNASNKTLEFSLQSGVKKQLKINYIWAEPYDNEPNYSGGCTSIFINKAIFVNNPKNYSLEETEQDNEKPTYEYAIRFIDSDSTNYEIKKSITGSAPEGSICIEYNDYIIEDYELVLSEDIEMEDGTIWFEINPNEQVNEFRLYYKKVDANDAPAEDGDGRETAVVGDNSSTPDTPPGEVSNNENVETNKSTPSIETESNPESQNNQQSQMNNSSEGSDSDNGTSENIENVSSVEETIDTTSSSSNEEDVENIPSSYDTNSEAEELTE